MTENRHLPVYVSIKTTILKRKTSVAKCTAALKLEYLLFLRFQLNQLVGNMSTVGSFTTLLNFNNSLGFIQGNYQLICDM